MTEPADRTTRALDGLMRGCPYIFLLLSLVASLFLAWNLPPFMGADELAHIDRALVGASGRVVGARLDKAGKTISGGPTEEAVYFATEPFYDARFDVTRKIDAADYVQGEQYRWGGKIFLADFRASASYPPFFYLPASAALAIGRAADLPIVTSLYMARAAQALACCAIGFLALLLAGRARLLLYTVMLLPMSMGLFSTLTNDGMLIAVTALGCALVGRAASQGRPMQGRELAGAAVCFALVGMTKVPYALFGLALLAVDSERPERRWRAALAVMAASLGWLALTALFVQVPLQRPGINPVGQIAFLLSHPLAVFDVAVQTLGANWRAYSEAFIGVLGWLDTFMPKPFYPLAWMVLAVAGAISAARAWPRAWRNLPWTTVLIIIGAVGLIHGALYVTWTPVGARVVEGVAGRYFLPLTCFLTLALEGARPLIAETRVGGKVRLALTSLVLAFPLLTLLIVERVIVVRYYLD